MEYKKITITLPRKLAEDYRKFCNDNGYNLSGRIAVLIKKDTDKSK